jgi:hypothetical protein
MPRDDEYSNLVSEIKKRADCRAIFRRFWPDRYKEKGNCLCPFHEDRDPSMQVTKDLAHCHAESLSLDAIDLFARGAACSPGEAIRLQASELGIEHHGDALGSRLQPRSEYFSKRMQDALGCALPDEAVRYLNGRGISLVTIEALKARKLIGWDRKLGGLAFPLHDWSGREIVGIQVIPVNGEKKRFVKGTEPKRGFFRFGYGQELTVFCEGIIDALSVAEAMAQAEGVALMSAGLTEKLGSIDLPPVPVLFMDNDDAGRKALAKIMRAHGSRGGFRVVDWQEVLRGVAEAQSIKDVNDLLKSGHAEAIVKMIESSRPPAGDDLQRILSCNGGSRLRAEQGGSQGESEADESKKQTQAQMLIMFAAGADFYHTPEKMIYASYTVNDHVETWQVRSKNFRRWLSHRFYIEQGKPPGSQAIQDALNILEAQGQYDGPEIDVFTRVAGMRGNIYIDLANEAWQVIEITPHGWSVIEDPPVKFRRTKGMLPLAQPEHGGSFEELRRFINLPDEDTLKLIIGWLVQAGHPSGPYPILNLEGEQGSGKSLAARLLRTLIDPSTAPIRTVPKEERDLIISATNSWIVAFDNLSGIPVWLSDALCRLSTGGGYAVRELYTNDEETIFSATRPLLLTGIDQIAARHDLADRSIVVNLPPIPDSRRIPEKKILADFRLAHPKILGAICDAISQGLKNLASTRLSSLPRMADFALWVTATEPALPWGRGEFLRAYMGNRTEAVELSLESDPISSAVRELMESRMEWSGTSSELLEKLCELVPEKIQKSQSWPKKANILSSKLKRSSTFLRMVGIDIEFYRTLRSGKRTIVIRRSGETPSSSRENEIEIGIADVEEPACSREEPIDFHGYTQSPEDEEQEDL